MTSLKHTIKALRKLSPINFAKPDIPVFSCRSPKEQDFRRGTARERGYDSDWEKVRKAHLRLEPLCRECMFNGIRRAADLVNHNIPVRARPDLRLDRKNLSSQCKGHHDTVIRELEAVAEREGDITLLAKWLRDPLTRPGRHAFAAKMKPAVLRMSSYEDGATS